MIKWLLIGLIALGVLVVGALLAVPLLLDSPAMQAYVQQTASHALGRPVKFGGLSISALPLPSVRLRQLQVAEDPAFGSGRCSRDAWSWPTWSSTSPGSTWWRTRPATSTWRRSARRALPRPADRLAWAGDDPPPPGPARCCSRGCASRTGR